MARYRKVDPRIWNDAKFRELSDDGKLVFFFLLTHPNMTSLGAMRHSIPGMAAEIGWDVERFGKGFGEPFGKGLVNHDERASFVWIPNFIKYNQPDNPNVVKAWDSAVDLLPECDMLNQLLEHVKGFLKGLPEPFRNGFRKGLANQEQEQEQNKEVSEKLKVASHDSQISLPCEDGSTFIFTESYLSTARGAYPLVDIPTQVEKARAWLLANPTRLKTRLGMTRFLNGWLSRANKDAEQVMRKDAAAAPPVTTGRAMTEHDYAPAPWVRSREATT